MYTALQAPGPWMPRLRRAVSVALNCVSSRESARFGTHPGTPLRITPQRVFAAEYSLRRVASIEPLEYFVRPRIQVVPSTSPPHAMPARRYKPGMCCLLVVDAQHHAAGVVLHADGNSELGRDRRTLSGPKESVRIEVAGHRTLLAIARKDEVERHLTREPRAPILDIERLVACSMVDAGLNLKTRLERPLKDPPRMGDRCPRGEGRQERSERSCGWRPFSYG